MTPQLSSLLFLVVGLSMAITPWLAAGGQLIASRFEQHDVRSLLPAESEVNGFIAMVDECYSIVKKCFETNLLTRTSIIIFA